MRPSRCRRRRAPTWFRSRPPTAANPHTGEVGGRNRDGRTRRMMRVTGRPEVSAAGPAAAVPELVLRGRVPVGVRVGNPAVDPRPLTCLQAVIIDGGDRSRVGDGIGAIEGPDALEVRCKQPGPRGVHGRVHDRLRGLVVIEPEDMTDFVRDERRRRRIGVRVFEPDRRAGKEMVLLIVRVACPPGRPPSTTP